MTKAIVDSLLSKYRTAVTQSTMAGNKTGKHAEFIYNVDFQDPPDILKVNDILL